MFEGSLDSEREAAGRLYAARIAAGHAFEKHHPQFGTMSREDFETMVRDTIVRPTEKKALSRGRTAFWNEAQQVVVITNPDDADGGTAFRPLTGWAYYSGLR